MAIGLLGPPHCCERAASAAGPAPSPPNVEDEGPPGYRNIELYLGCDWDGKTPTNPERRCKYRMAKKVSPLFIGGPTCPLVRITRARFTDPPEDLAEAKALDDALAGRGCRVTAPSVPAKDDPQVLVYDLATSEHGFDQWNVVVDLSTGETIGDQIIADHDLYMK